MSGTSADSVDAALVSFNTQKISLQLYNETPLPSHLQETLARIRSGDFPITFQEFGELDIQLGILFSEAANQLIHSAGLNPAEIAAIGSHGQTIFHHPQGNVPFTLQLGDPSTIAYRTGIMTIADFRSMDIAAGGQGAPLTPAFHEAVFRDKKNNRAIVNLGGIANITLLPAATDQPVIGFDTGPANALMDEWILKHLQEPYDKHGEWAKSGRVIKSLLEKMLADDFFQQPPPKSTGREYFNYKWLDRMLEENTYSPKDVQATLLQLTVETIRQAIETTRLEIREIILCGGGAHNYALVQGLKKAFPDKTLRPSDDYGINPDCIEAMAFAWLAKCRLENQPANIPSVTGAEKAVVLGAIYKKS